LKIDIKIAKKNAEPKDETTKCGDNKYDTNNIKPAFITTINMPKVIIIGTILINISNGLINIYINVISVAP